MASNENLATGRRKSSAARVFMKPGKGVITGDVDIGNGADIFSNSGIIEGFVELGDGSNTFTNSKTIKGNVTNQGLIYHPPWSPWYSKINMETAKGKRWFCSESEAIDAGWRPSGAR